MKIYDEDGFCGQEPASPLMTDFFLPRMLDAPGKSNGEWMEYFWWEIRNFGYQSPYIPEMTNLDWLLLDLLANRAVLPLHRFLGADRDWAAVYKGGGSVLLSDEALISDLQRFKDEGYKTTKFKIGGSGADFSLPGTPKQPLPLQKKQPPSAWHGWRSRSTPMTWMP